MRNDPRFMIAKFKSVCPETGLPINKGDECCYFPAARKAYHIESKAASGWKGQAAADACGLSDAGW